VSTGLRFVCKEARLVGWAAALAVWLHSDLAMSNLRAFALTVSIGLGIGGLWALVFCLPAVIRDANLRSLAADNIRREAEHFGWRSSA
jgi:hypothetical protein